MKGPAAFAAGLEMSGHSGRRLETASAGIEGIQRLTGGHQQTVALLSDEADVGADFWQQDATDQGAIRSKHADPILALAP